MKLAWALIGIAGATVLTGCLRKPEVPPAPSDPVSFLKWSMDRYAAFPSYQSTAQVMTLNGKEKLSDQIRLIRVEPPNKFRVEASGGKALIYAISDGVQEQDYDNLRQPSSVFQGAAPAHISLADSPDMLDPSLCGSPLYAFFGGSKNYSRVAKGPVTFVGVGQTNGEEIKVVHFNSPGLLSNIRAFIGVNTGYVYQLAYDLSGAKDLLMAKIDGSKLSGPGSEQKAAVAKLLKTSYVERYGSIKTEAPLSRGSFDPNLPGPAALASYNPGTESDQPPLPLHAPAPEFTVQTLAGKSISLKDLRGHPVMIDFWATWCAPCRAALPETAHIQERGAKSGLVVLAVSDESAPTIQNFLASQSYRLTAYCDKGDAAQQTYKVGSIPAQIVIDKKGALVAYLSGDQPAKLKSALAEVGVKL